MQDVAIICVSLTDYASAIDAYWDWYQEVKNLCRPKAPIVIVETKHDIQEPDKGDFFQKV